jgi:hypothetical protein
MTWCILSNNDLCVEHGGEGEVVVDEGLEKACMTLLETTKTQKRRLVNRQLIKWIILSSRK